MHEDKKGKATMKSMQEIMKCEEIASNCLHLF
jgi:hypothetical protein